MAQIHALSVPNETVGQTWRFGGMSPSPVVVSCGLTAVERRTFPPRCPRPVECKRISRSADHPPGRDGKSGDRQSPRSKALALTERGANLLCLPPANTKTRST